MLDGLRDIFLDALRFVPKEKRRSLVDKWNEECEEVYYIKCELVRKAMLSQRRETDNGK